MRVLINFHFSDSWADPGQQTKPQTWCGITFQQLLDSVAIHTTVVLQKLQQAGVSPDWVQIGNETNDGMLWPDGKASLSMQNFASLLNVAYAAVKKINAGTKVIIHLSNGWDINLYRWMFDGLVAQGAKFDVVGMSLYPTVSNWQTFTSLCLDNMNDVVSRYGKEVMIVEVGMSWDQPVVCKQFLKDIIARQKNVRNNKGLGVFYWEPQSYANWQGYTLGAFDNTGKPTLALTAFGE